MNHPRRGSLLFLLIMLVAVLTLIAFAFVRTIQLNTAAAKSDTLFLLTQGAAQAGLDHAVSAILSDYAKTSVKLRNGAGSVSTINSPPTVLEGAWRQPFTSLFRPNTRHNFGNVADTDDQSAWDDVREEDQIDAPFIVFWWGGWNYSVGSSFNNGYTYHDGRGRFYEPGFLNRPWVGTEATPPPAVPTVPLRFTDAAPAASDYSKGLWLDEQLRPVDETDPVIARRLARYRLRYAIGVDDLDGKLLANGDVWLEHPNVTDTDPAGVLVAAGNSGGEPNLARLQRLVRWSPVMFNLVQASSGTVPALRAEHVFLNRGSTANHAKGFDGFPVTFPLEWREVQQTNGSSGKWSVFGYNQGNSYPTQLYQYINGGGTMITAPAVTGGSPLAKESTEGRLTLGGPQYSFENLRLANSNVWENQDIDGKAVFHRLFTPFGRGMSANAEVATYRDDVDCPWRVNVMTAPRNVVSAMLNAYIPWRTRTGHYDSISYYGQEKTDKLGNAFPHKGQTLVLSANVDRAEQARDCFNRKFNLAFDAYKGPTKAAGIDSSLEPNWWTADARAVSDRYPGPLMAPVDPGSLAAGQGPDDCGREIATMDMTNPNWDTAGWCIYSQGGFFNTPGELGCAPPSDPGTTIPADWTTRLSSNEMDGNGQPVDYYVWNWAYLKVAKPNKFTYGNSYFFDMAWAMAQAVSVMRMQWSQYDNSYGTSWAPTKNVNFSPTALWNPTAYQTLADLDRLFLENLGIDITQASSNTVVDGWQIAWQWVDPWKVTRGNVATNNIRTLRKLDKLASTPAGSYSSLDRSRVMELVLNDFRMSFFGSNPDYRPTFRALDCNGDGVVHCSAYSSNSADLMRPVAVDSPAESSLPPFLTHAAALALHLDQWRPVVANDAGPAVDNAFSISGNFYLGKSRYYHIVTRGELWDNLVQRPVSGLTLDSVLAVDPAVRGANGLNASSILYQRYHWNKYRGALSRTGE